MGNLQGIITVLIILVIALVLWVVLRNNGRTRNKEEAETTFLAQPDDNPPAESIASNGESKRAVQDGSISPAVVAAIMASVCAMTGKPAEELKFTAIRRISGIQPVWAMVGTADVISTRQRFIERGNK